MLKIISNILFLIIFSLNNFIINNNALAVENPIHLESSNITLNNISSKIDQDDCCPHKTSNHSHSNTTPCKHCMNCSFHCSNCNFYLNFAHYLFIPIQTYNYTTYKENLVLKSFIDTPLRPPTII